MAVTIVQYQPAGETGATSNGVRLPSYPTPTTNGNSILVLCVLYSSDGGSNEIDMAATNPVVDDASGGSNAYIPIGAAEVKRVANNWYQHTYWYLATNAKPFLNVTATFSRSTWNFISVYELTPCRFDQAVTGQGTGTSNGFPINIGTLTPSANGALVFMEIQHDGAGSPNLALSGGWTQDRFDSAGGGQDIVGHQTQTTAGPITFSGTGSTTAWQWSASGIVLVPPAAPVFLGGKPAVAQSASNSGGSTSLSSLSAALPRGVTAGNAMIVVTGRQNTSSPDEVVTDSLGTVYRPIQTDNDAPSSYYITTWIGRLKMSGPNTVQYGSGGANTVAYLRIAAVEVRNVNWPDLAVADHGTGTALSSGATTGLAHTGFASEYETGWMISTAGSVVADTVSGWTQRELPGTELLEDAIPGLPAGTAVTATASAPGATGTDHWQAMLTTFYESVSPHFVQSQAFFSGAGATSMVQAFDNPVEKGDLIVVALGAIGAGSAPWSSITDTLGTTYVAADVAFSNANLGYPMALYYGVAPAGGANTVTCSLGGFTGTYRRMLIAEYWGVDTLDQGGHTDDHGSGTAMSSDPFTTTHAHEVLFSWIVNNSAYSSAGTGWTTRATAGSEAIQDSVDAPVGTYQSLATGGFDHWTIEYASFYAATPVVLAAPMSSTAVASVTATVTTPSTTPQPITATAVAVAAVTALVTTTFTALNNAEGGTNGTTVTTGNSGGASGLPWDVVDIGSGATVIFDATHTAHGGLAYEFATAATSALARVQWNTLGTPSKVWFRAYVYLAALPAATIRLCNADQGATACAVVVCLATGKLQVRTGSAGTQTLTTTNTVPVGQWFRIEGYCLGDPAVGQVELKLFLAPDSATPTETQTSAATVNTTGTMNHFNFGVSTTQANVAAFWEDDVGFSTVGYLGPAGVPIVASAQAVTVATTQVTAASLTTPTAQAAATTTASVTAASALTPGAQAVGTAAAALRASALLVPSAQAVAAAAAPITAAAVLSVSAQAVSAAVVALRAPAVVVPSAQAVAAAVATVTTALVPLLSPSAQAVSAVSAVLRAPAALVPMAGAVSQAVAGVAVAARIAPQAGAVSHAAGTVVTVLHYTLVTSASTSLTLVTAEST